MGLRSEWDERRAAAPVWFTVEIVAALVCLAAVGYVIVALIAHIINGRPL